MVFFANSRRALSRAFHFSIEEDCFPERFELRTAGEQGLEVGMVTFCVLPGRFYCFAIHIGSIVPGIPVLLSFV